MQKSGTPTPTAKEDRRKLAALLDSNRLTEDEEKAFRSMLSHLEAHLGGRPVLLTEKQRQWVEAIYLKLGLDAHEGCHNLYSQGVGHPDKPLPKMEWEKMPLPLSPPGRKPNF